MPLLCKEIAISQAITSGTMGYLGHQKGFPLRFWCYSRQIRLGGYQTGKFPIRKQPLVGKSSSGQLKSSVPCGHSIRPLVIRCNHRPNYHCHHLFCHLGVVKRVP
ncbi:hypothetical protein L211DRAFT_681887 [Terfezia boudieri ATCC MYA-4762]|uniref:PI-PLC Y-box domain-containing protein n=1 Tax=Terfezia boudieri ATCC MYA-4762 TaxID=1051890 RepID=A0A3N4LZI1_9PEZI|nr:hypothetical protein L211DRAFT_681887 [Terfezia boudieri ATCC MYA-4762]